MWMSGDVERMEMGKSKKKRRRRSLNTKGDARRDREYASVQYHDGGGSCALTVPYACWLLYVLGCTGILSLSSY